MVALQAVSSNAHTMLQEIEPLMKDCVLVMMTVSANGTFDMVSNADPNELPSILMTALRKSIESEGQAVHKM